MIRFLDRKDVKQLVNKSSDFRKRRYGSLMKWISYIIILIAFAFALNVNKVLYEVYTGVDMVLASDVLLTILFMAVVGFFVTGYLMAVIYNLRHLLTAIEFQSAMLSSSARVNTKFLIIANSDNSIVYADLDAIAIFSEKYLHTISEFLGNSISNKDDRDKVRNAIAEGNAQQCSVTYKDINNQEKAVLLLINPLDKPRGYFCIKGV